MTHNASIYSQSDSELNGKFLEASQQLQIDKQTYGPDYIHLYVDDIEGNWLENWDWEDNLTDYIDAFYHHFQNQNYQLAFDVLMVCDELMKQPEIYQKWLEVNFCLLDKGCQNDAR